MNNISYNKDELLSKLESGLVGADNALPVDIMCATAQLSIAISLKRIADALDRPYPIVRSSASNQHGVFYVFNPKTGELKFGAGQ